MYLNFLTEAIVPTRILRNKFSCGKAIASRLGFYLRIGQIPFWLKRNPQTNDDSYSALFSRLLKKRTVFECKRLLRNRT